MLRIYDINFDKLIVQLLPINLRKRIIYDWLLSLFSPIKKLQNDFRKFKDQAIYKVTHNSGVFSMENVFNDKYDYDLRRIYITDSFESTPNYIYRRSENNPGYIYRRSENNTTMYLHRKSFFSPADVDFVIVFPLALKPIDAVGLSITENEIIELADYYKLASKRYGIVWI